MRMLNIYSAKPKTVVPGGVRDTHQGCCVKNVESL